MRIVRYLMIVALAMISSKANCKTNNASGSKTILTNHVAPGAFIENKGQITDQNKQFRNDIQFKIPAAPGLNVFIGSGAIHYQFSHVLTSILNPQKGKVTPNSAADMYRMDVTLVGANPNAKVITEHPAAYTERHNISALSGNSIIAHAYNKITYQNIYPHIDWVLTMSNGKLEHEFVVHEGGDPASILLMYGGATALNIAMDGSLEATTPQGLISEQAPFAFEQAGHNTVSCAYELHGNMVSYRTAGFTGSMIIDPGINWGTYYGGIGSDYSNAVAVDAAGDAVITGYTNSLSNIATIGAYQSSFVASQDAFVAKFNNTGSIMWATYFGGSGYTLSQGAAIDTAGNIYITGASTCTSGIATGGAYQTTMAGGGFYGDAILAKFNDTGALVWATYFGGPNDDNGNAVAVDDSGNVFMTGFTASATGIATHGAYDTVYAGGLAYGDAFIAKFTGAGALSWSTYYGGADDDYANGLTTDHAGNIYITGATASTSGIATTGSFESTYADSTDGFLAQFTTAGTLNWATYYGGASKDMGMSVATDAANNVYITGGTFSDTGIASTGAFMTTYGGAGDAFLAKFNVSGSRLWGTYYGGAAIDAGNSVTINSNGDVYVGGNSVSTSGIATTSAYQSAFGGGSFTGDAFYAKFDTLGALHYGTYYGGSDEDICNGIAAYGTGNVYLTGNTASSASIASTLAYQTVYGGSGDGFLAEFCNLPEVPAISGHTIVCAGSRDTLTDTMAGGTWSASNAFATVTSGVVTGATPGTDTIMYTVTNTCGPVTVNYAVTVPVIPNVDSVTSQTLCRDSLTTAVIFTGSVTGTVFNWHNSNTGIGLAANDTGSIATFTVINTGTSNSVADFTVTPSNEGCPGPKTTFTITVLPAPNPGTIVGPSIACFGVATSLYDVTGSGTWSVSNGNVSIAGACNVTGNVVGGTDSVFYTVTTSCGTASVYKVLTVDSLPVVLPISGTDTVCQGASITLSDPTPGGWWHASNSDLNLTGAVVSGVAGGIDSVFYTIGSPGCGDTTAYFIVTVDPYPLNNAISGSSNVCQGDTVMLSGETPGGTWVLSNTNASISGDVLLGINTGNDSVLYILSNSCGTDTASLLVNILPAPVPAISQSDSTLSTSGSFATYQWYFNGSPITGATNASYYATDTGSYYLVVTNTSGCYGISTTLDVNNLSVGQLTLAGTIHVFPNPAQSTIAIQSPVPVNVWISSIDGKILMQQTNAQMLNIADLANGVYLLNICDPQTGLKITTSRIVKTSE